MFFILRADNACQGNLSSKAALQCKTAFVVGVAGFEPAASWTQTMRDTKLRHTPIA